jgi:hypothetical protein
VIKARSLRVKAFQVFFGRDGSLFISFPYFRHRIGILSASAIPANGAQESKVDLEHGGKVTSHLVKYSHHPDGRAHFSQTGKIVTAIKRQSIALDTQHGHMFSLLIQGFGALDVAEAETDTAPTSKRHVINFEAEPTQAVKFVGRWFDVNRMRFSNPTATIGPIVPLIEPDGLTTRPACLVASPYTNARHVLALSCEPIPTLGPEPEIFMFYGGFDPAETMMDVTKEAGFLAFLYPIREVEAIRERVGSVDYVAKKQSDVT